MPAPLPVLFTHYGEDWIRGSENVLLDLLRHLDRGRIAPVVWCNAPAMEAACRELSVPTYRSDFAIHFDYPDSSAPFSWSGYAGRVREAVSLIRRHGIRVLHANSAAPTQWLAPAAAWTRTPLLTHLHIGYMRRSRYALLLHEADLLVGVAAAMTEPLRADGVPASRLRTIHNGIDPARLAPSDPPLRARLGLTPGVFVIGSIGSLILRKGHDLLLQALARLEGAVALIAGAGPDAQAIEALARELGVAERVRFLGHMPDPGSLYAACDVFVLAARREGLPLVLAEAGWCGRPVVATAVGGVPELVRDRETGLLVPREDPQALAAALERLAADPGLRERLGRAARRHVAEGFTVQAMATRFADTYETLAAAGRAASLAPWRLSCYARLLAGRAGRP